MIQIGALNVHHAIVVQKTKNIFRRIKDVPPEYSRGDYLENFETSEIPGNFIRFIPSKTNQKVPYTCLCNFIEYIIILSTYLFLKKKQRSKDAMIYQELLKLIQTQF